MNEGFLSFESIQKGTLVRLNSKQIVKLVKELSTGFKQSKFPVHISNAGLLYRNKLVFGETERALLQEDLDCLFDELIICLPLTLMSTGVESHPYAAAIRDFAVILADRVSVPTAEQCLNRLKNGFHEKLLTDFYSTVPADIKLLLPGYLFVNHNLLRSVWNLRKLTQPKDRFIASAASSSSSLDTLALTADSVSSYQSTTFALPLGQTVFMASSLMLRRLQWLSCCR